MLQHPRADLFGRVTLHPESDGGGLADFFRSSVELYAGEIHEGRAEGLGERCFVFFDRLHGAREFLALRAAFAQGGDEVQGAFHPGDPFVVLGARLQLVRDVIRRRVEPVDAHLLEEVAPYGRNTDVRAEELVGRACDDVGPYCVVVYGNVRGCVHGVDGDEGACTVGSLGDGGHVVHGTDRVRGQSYGYEFRPFVDVLLQIVPIEGEGFGIYPDPAHSRPLLCGGDEPGVHVGAVVELCDDDLGVSVPPAGESAGDREGQGGHVGPEGDLVGRGPQEIRSRHACFGQDLLCLCARREDAVKVRPAALHVARDGVDSLPRHLRASWPVEVDDTAAVIRPAERRELLADGLYVESTLHKSSHLGTSCPAQFTSGEGTSRRRMLPYAW